jgi:hypothetical protein
MLCKSTTRSSHIMFRGLQTNSLCNNPSDTAFLINVPEYNLQQLLMYENLLIMIMYRHTYMGIWVLTADDYESYCLMWHCVV